MCTCMYMTAQGNEFPDDVALCWGKSWAGFNFFDGQRYIVGNKWGRCVFSRCANNIA